VIEEGHNEDGISPSSTTFDSSNGANEQPWSRPPVYRGPRSPPTVALAKSPPPQAVTEEPLPQVLHALDDEDDARIVVVRRITKLGFKSNRMIKTKFERLGWGVKNVVLLPSRARSIYPDGSHTAPNGVSQSHARPSSMGFVVFKTIQAANECIKRGTVNVDGIDVLVQPFVRQYKPSSSPSSGATVQSST
jgi:hypothetical protein